MVGEDSAMTEYATYLGLGDVLAAAHPRSDLPDEMMFIIAHQVHELWFKQLLYELDRLREQFTNGLGAPALHTLDRCSTIIVAMNTPMDVLATLDPMQFHGFRPKLGTASGFQSAQFRALEAALGRRDHRMAAYFPAGSQERQQIEAELVRPSVFDTFLHFLAGLHYPVPPDRLRRDFSQPPQPSPAVREVLVRAYLDDGIAAQLCERLVSLDQGVQEWRYRHYALADRLLGGKSGTGGSAGSSYLRTTLLTPIFADLWIARSEL